jgi:hypothetical protein
MRENNIRTKLVSSSSRLEFLKKLRGRQRMTDGDALGAEKFTEKIIRVFISAIGNQARGKVYRQRILVKWVGPNDGAMRVDGLDADFHGFDTGLNRNVDIIERFCRPKFAGVAVEWITIAEKLRELIEDLHILVIGPHLVFRREGLELIRIAQLIQQL